MLALTSFPALRAQVGPSEDDGEVFERVSVLDLRLILPETSLAALRQDPRAYVRATLLEGERDHGEVGLRLKGSAGSFRPLDGDKPGFTVKVNAFQPKKRFHRVRKLILNNAVQDPSYVSELLGNDLFRKAGIPAPRATFARLKLNDKPLGLYVLFEGVSREFLARHFESPFGNLYEGPGDVSGDLDTDTRGPFLDRDDLHMLANAASETDPVLRLKRLGEVLDLDRFITFLAMEAILWHWDGYAAGVNNYRVYNDPGTGRMVFLPHGSDQLFQDPTGSLAPDSQGLVARAVLETAGGRKLYRERITALLAEVFQLEAITRRIQDLTAVVRPALESNGHADFEAQREAAKDLLRRIELRMQSVDEQLTGSGGILGEPLFFDGEGTAQLSGWKPRQRAGSPETETAESAGVEKGPALRVRAAGEEGCIASWRLRVGLEAGRYRFTGMLRVEGVERLEREEGEGAYPSGACLRVSGRHPEEKVTGSSPWQRFDFDFDVGGDDPDSLPASRPVELVCELRAAKGEVWFDAASLRIKRR